MDGSDWSLFATFYKFYTFAKAIHIVCQAYQFPYHLRHESEIRMYFACSHSHERILIICFEASVQVPISSIFNDSNK